MDQIPYEPYPEDPDHGTRDAFRLMGAGIPLSLLMDLALSDPRSTELLAAETPEDTGWLTGMAPGPLPRSEPVSPQ